MLVLRSSSPSPFGRKIKIAVDVLGLSEKVTVEAANTADPDDTIRKQNPLGKIPALVLENGTVLYDSRVIIEYLDHFAGGGKILPADESRFDILRLQALSDGIMDAGILQVYERRFRAKDKQDDGWLAYQAEKVTRALEMLENDTPARVNNVSDVNAGNIALACALGYQDVRFSGDWRNIYPGLTAWLASFEATVPAFEKTKVAPTGLPTSSEPLR